MSETLERSGWLAMVDPRRGLIVRPKRNIGYMRLMKPVRLAMTVAMLLATGGLILNQKPILTGMEAQFNSLVRALESLDNTDNRLISGNPAYRENFAARDN